MAKEWWRGVEECFLSIRGDFWGQAAAADGLVVYCLCWPVALGQCLCVDKIGFLQGVCRHWLFCARRLSSRVPRALGQAEAAGNCVTGGTTI